MRISAILPTYNRAHTLGRALASVFAQSRAADEVIVVDDGSTDGSPAVLARFPQVRLLRLPDNGGAARARNRGVAEARGDCIAFIDSDDEWLPGKLAAQVARWERVTGLALLGTGVTLHRTGGAVQRLSLPEQPPAHGWSFDDLHRYPFSTSTWLVDRQALLDAGGFDEQLPNCEDLDLLARLVMRGARIEMLPDALMTKHNQPDGLDADLARRRRSYATLCERHRALWSRDARVAAATQRRLAELHLAAGDLPRARAALAEAARFQPGALRFRVLGTLSRLGARPVLATLALYRRLLRLSGR